MSLLFGNLTQSFVNFSVDIKDAKTNSTVAQRLPGEAQAFRTTAANDAADLVYIGTLPCFIFLVAPSRASDNFVWIIDIGIAMSGHIPERNHRRKPQGN